MSEHSKNVGVKYCEQCKREYRNKLLEDLVVIIQKRLDRLQEYSDEDPVKKMLVSLQEEFKEFGYMCGDDCKGECSGEVDGVIHCPHQLLYTPGDIIDLVKDWQKKIDVERNKVLDELINEFDPTWIDYNYVCGVIKKFKKKSVEGEFSTVKKDSKNFNKGQITGSYKKPHVSQTLDELQMWERQQGR
jgi:hypothetical protein